MRATLFRRTNCENSFQLIMKTGRNFGAFIVLTSVKLCKPDDESKRIFATSDEINGKWYTDQTLFLFMVKIFVKFYFIIFKDFLIKSCLSLAADRFTFAQDSLVTDSIAVYNTSNNNFSRKVSKIISLVVVVYWFKFSFLFSGVLVASEPLNNS